MEVVDGEHIRQRLPCPRFLEAVFHRQKVNVAPLSLQSLEKPVAFEVTGQTEKLRHGAAPLDVM
jgi:hypothetical protein